MCTRKMIFVLLVAALALPLAGIASAADSVAPDFALPNMDGKDVKLSQLLDHGPVIVDFWATWCKPCIKGFPALQQITDKYREQGLTVLAVSVDSPKSRERVAPFIRSQKYTFEVLYDTEGKVSKKYSAVAIPRTVLINSKGEIVLTTTGYRPSNEEQLDAAVRALLPETEAEGAVGE
jgi:peroxiredoxin